MKRGYLKRGTSQLKRTPIRKVSPNKVKKVKVAGHETAKDIKIEIQATLRQIVMLRDKKCILFGIRCNNEIGDDGIVWQAEHLIERSNSGTYGDSRLVVLVCKNCHGWKHFTKSNHDQYDKWVRTKLSKERVELWDKCREDSWKTSKMDWKLVLLQLKQELRELSTT